MTRGTTSTSGFRCSSTGVAVSITTYSAVDRVLGLGDATSRPSWTARRSGPSAPFSRNGSRPAFTVSTAARLKSWSVTVSPREASATPSGSPTRPQPPRMATSLEKPSDAAEASEKVVHEKAAEFVNRMVAPYGWLPTGGSSAGRPHCSSRAAWAARSESTIIRTILASDTGDQRSPTHLLPLTAAVQHPTRNPSTTERAASDDTRTGTRKTGPGIRQQGPGCCVVRVAVGAIRAAVVGVEYGPGLEMSDKYFD